MSYNLTGATVSSTYGRLVQTINGSFYDGFGNLLNPFGVTSSNISVLWTGDWDSAMSYYNLDAVKYAGNTYVCVDGDYYYTATAPFDSPDQLPGTWTLFTVSTVINSSTFLLDIYDTISNAGTGRLLVSDGTSYRSSAQQNLTFDGSTLTINGDLRVIGTTSTIGSQNLIVKDPIIVLADGQTGTPSVDAGFFIDRGNGATQGIIWDESEKEFAFIQTNSPSNVYGNVGIATYSNVRGNIGNFSHIEAYSATFSYADIDDISSEIGFISDLEVNDIVGDYASFSSIVGSAATFSNAFISDTTTETLVISNIGPTSSATKHVVVDDIGRAYYQIVDPFYFQTERPSPDPTTLGARWIDSDTGKEYVWVFDGSSYAWMQPTQLVSMKNSTNEIPYPTYSAIFSFEYYGVIYMGGICTVTLPKGTSPDDDGKFITIADEVGGISKYNRGIRVQGTASQMINGQSDVLMKIDRMSLTFMYRNSSWKTI